MASGNPSNQLSTTLGGREEQSLDKSDYRPVIEAEEKSAEAPIIEGRWRYPNLPASEGSNRR